MSILVPLLGCCLATYHINNSPLVEVFKSKPMLVFARDLSSY